MINIRVPWAVYFDSFCVIFIHPFNRLISDPNCLELITDAQSNCTLGTSKNDVLGRGLVPQIARYTQSKQHGSFVVSGDRFGVHEISSRVF